MKTAAIVVRSLWAAERSSWIFGEVLGWVVDWRELVWPVFIEVLVVIAVDIWRADFFLGRTTDEDLPMTVNDILPGA